MERFVVGYSLSGDGRNGWGDVSVEDKASKPPERSKGSNFIFVLTLNLKR